jgi:hypothetical protein
MKISRDTTVAFIKALIATIIGTSLGTLVGFLGYDGLTGSEITLLLITSLFSVIVVTVLHKWYS